MAAEIPQKIDDRPQKKYLNRHVRDQLTAACETNAQQWKDLGIELIPDGEAAVSTIAANNKGDVTSCCASMFDKWLEKDPKASWRQLIEALDIIGLGALATQIKLKLEFSTVPQVSQASGLWCPRPSVLAQKVQMYELINIVIPKVKAHWQNLAYAMKYDIGEVEAFDKEGRDLEERCKKMFTNWLTTGHGPTPKTYETLLKYIKKIDNLTAAREAIEKELIKALSG